MTGWKNRNDRARKWIRQPRFRAWFRLDRIRNSFLTTLSSLLKIAKGDFRAPRRALRRERAGAYDASVNLNSPSGNRLWTRDFVLDLLTAHFMFVSYTAMFTLVPLYTQALGGDERALGIAVGSFGVAGVLVRPFSGRWVYSFGPKKVAVAGTAVFAVATVLHIWAADVWAMIPPSALTSLGFSPADAWPLILPARAVQGIGLAIGPVATSTIVANLAPARRRAEAMGVMGNSISAASLYSPLLAFWVLQRFDENFAFPFAYAAVAGAAGTVAALGMSSARTGIPAPPPSERGANESGADKREKAPLVSRAALFPTAIFLTYTITTAPVSTFLPLLAEERGFGNPGLFFTLNSVSSMLSLWVGGLISDRVGRAAMIVPGLLAVAAGMFILSAAEIMPLFVVSGLFSGVGFGMIQPSMQSLTVDRAPTRERGAALATLQQAWDIGGSGGAFAFGAVGAAVGTATTFAIAGSGTIIGAVGFVAGSALGRRGGREA